MKKQLINAALTLKKNVRIHKPDIYMGVGVVGIVATTVLACRASIKLKDVLEEANANVDEVVVKGKKALEIHADKYSESDYKKDVAIVKTTKYVKVAKLYAPAVILGINSLYFILSSHKIMKDRQTALLAAYNLLDAGYKKYRERVREKYGKDVDDEMRFGTTLKKMEIEEIGPDGKKRKVKKNIHVGDKIMSEYAVIFDEYNPNWSRDSDTNRFFLNTILRTANDKLFRDGIVTLNDVYDMVGVSKTTAGQIVGWVYDPRNEKHVGDNYIDFGIYDFKKNPEAVDFQYGNEKSIILDFNVDGPIINKFDEVL